MSSWILGRAGLGYDGTERERGVGQTVDYEPLGLHHQQAYRTLWGRCAQRSSDQSFLVLWAWNETLGYQVAPGEDLLWIRQLRPDPVYLPPVGGWDREDWASRLLEAVGEEARFLCVPEALVRVWQDRLGGRIRVREDRDAFEYLHRVEELADLKGNRYMRKRNHINRFRRTHAYRYLPLEEGLIPRVAELQRIWCEERECRDRFLLWGEHRGILRVLEDWGRLEGLLGGALEVEGRLVAYTLGEDLGDRTLMIHFEKACPRVPDAYQVIHRDFLDRHRDRFDVVNREEDMGDPGIREAKMSYLPFDFLRKYQVEWSLRGFAEDSDSTREG